MVVRVRVRVTVTVKVTVTVRVRTRVGLRVRVRVRVRRRAEGRGGSRRLGQSRLSEGGVVKQRTRLRQHRLPGTAAQVPRR